MTGTQQGKPCLFFQINVERSTKAMIIAYGEARKGGQ